MSFPLLGLTVPHSSFLVPPCCAEAQVLGRQLLRSATSVGAQYREAVRARSRAEFVGKIETALQELEETAYWMELLADGGVVQPASLQGVLREVEELIAIFVQSPKTAKRSR